MAAVCAVALLLAASGSGSAQTNLETNAPGIQLNFSTPGARSLALGGTFLGRADDATAAYANPAGLANLPAREVSLEIRSWGYTHVFTDTGEVVGQPGDAGFDAGLVDGEASDEVLGPSFASFVYPRRRWALAAYFHTLADFEANFETDGALLRSSSGRERGFLNPAASRSRLEILSLGVAASYRISSSLSVGVGLARYEFQIGSTLDRGDIDEGEIFREPPVDRQTQTGSDTEFGATLGLLWRLGPRVQVGGVYRQGPSFAFQARNVFLPGQAGEELLFDEPAVFNVPDQWGVGVMWQTTDRMTLGADYYRIGYSVFAEDFTDVFELGEVDSYTAEDGNELHFSLEYAFPNGSRPWWLRSGVWYDPEHGVRYVGERADEAARFREREGLWHWAAGGGVVGSSYQVDLGVDYSQRTTTFSVSTVFRF